MAKIHTGADVKRQFKPLSEADIQAYSDDASFRKGYDSYLKHAIVEPILSELVLRAFYQRSSGSHYRVEATLLPAGDKSAHKVVSASGNLATIMAGSGWMLLERLRGMRQWVSGRGLRPGCVRR